jgi:predicted transcriptional regulator
MSGSEKAQMSIRVPSSMIESFDKLAKVLDRDRTWVMLRAFRQYLDGEGTDLLQEAEGIAALDRGEGVDFDQVMAEGDEIIAQLEAEQSRKTG